MLCEIGLVVCDVTTVALKASLSLVLVDDVALQVLRVRKPSFADAATQNRLVGVVVTLLFMRFHLPSARRCEVATAIDALHRLVRFDERRVSQVRRN